MAADRESMFSPPTALPSESQEQADSLTRHMIEYIKPSGILEQMLAYDVVDMTLHINRLQKTRTEMIKIARRPAPASLLDELGIGGDYFEREMLADGYFRGKAEKQKVNKMLKDFDLDESAIEAQAIRRLGPQLEMLERHLTSLEARREKTLRLLDELQVNAANGAREVSKHLIVVESDRDRELAGAAE